MNYFLRFFILCSLAVARNVEAKKKKDELAPGIMAAIFKNYDTAVDEEPDCQPDFIDDQVCPKDEKIPCAPIPEIEAYCKQLLGPVVLKQMEGVEMGKGENAIKGCIKYVGYHVVDEDHLACCPSEHCEQWLEETFNNMEDYYDGDEDDDYYEGDEF